MKLLNPIRLSVGLAALFVAQAGWAVGTLAGTDVNNQATLSYSVGGSGQTAIPSNIATFKVDRKIDLTVTGDKTLDVSDPTEPSGTYEVAPLSDGTLPAPAAAANELRYTLKNEGNATQDFEISVANLVTGDDFDALDCQVEVEDNNGVSVVAPVAITATPKPIVTVSEDLEFDILVTCDMPDIDGTNVVDNALSTLEVTATAVYDAVSALEPDPVKAVGSVMVESGADRPDEVDVVLADDSGTGDGDRDAMHSATQTYEITAPDLDVEKSSVVITDPVNCPSTANPVGADGNHNDFSNTEAKDATQCANNPKRIPGAVIEYTITISNSSGTAPSGVSISDAIQSDVTFVPGSVEVNGSTTADFNYDAAATPNPLLTVGIVNPSDGSGGITVPAASGGTDGEVEITFRVTVN